MTENFYGITDTGKLRDNNEDNFIAQKILNDKYIAGCVIDGVGGYKGGEVAASIARTAILNTLKKSANNILENLKKAFVEANQKITERKQKSGEHLQMACVATLALADVINNKFYYAHVGDTRLYLFRDKSLVKVSHDHSFVGFLEESGRLTEEAAMNHPRRNEINKALGFDDGKFSDADYIETGESPFLPNDILLLCSDGLYDMLDSKTITGILNSPVSIKEKSKELINAANAAGGKDNITVVLIQNNKQPLQTEATKPVIIKKKELINKEPEAKTTIIKDAVRKKSGAGSRFFAVLILLILAALAWFIYNDYFKPKNSIVTTAQLIAETHNTQTKILIDSLQNLNAKQLWFKNLFGQYRDILLNDTLLINQDSLHINGNGAILIADSSYNGIAMLLSFNCKYILIDSLTFENFNTAIVMNSKALHLKNVHFVNCKTSVTYNMQLPDDMNISGIISDSNLIKQDSAKTRTIIKTAR